MKNFLNDLDNNNDFPTQSHYDHDGNLIGFKTKNIFGGYDYQDENGNYTHHSQKNIFGHHDVYDKNMNFEGSTISGSDNHNFLNSNGSFGYQPDMYHFNDHNYHNQIHDHFSGIRTNLLKSIQ